MIFMILTIVLLVSCLSLLIDNNLRLNKIEKKLEIYSIEDQMVSNEEIEKEFEKDLNQN